MPYITEENEIKAWHRTIFIHAYEIQTGDVLVIWRGTKPERAIVEEARWSEDNDGSFYLMWAQDEEDLEGGEFCEPGKQFILDLTETYDNKRHPV